MIPGDTSVFYVNLTLNRMSGAQSQTTRPRTREQSLLELERHEEISRPFSDNLGLGVGRRGSQPRGGKAPAQPWGYRAPVTLRHQHCFLPSVKLPLEIKYQRSWSQGIQPSLEHPTFPDF